MRLSNSLGGWASNRPRATAACAWVSGAAFQFSYAAMAVLIGRRNIGWELPLPEYLATTAGSAARDKMFVSTRMIFGSRGWLATISRPVTGEPAASARFLTAGVGQDFSLRRN